MPGKHEIKELQRTTTPGTAHILGRIVMQKHVTFNMGLKCAIPVVCTNKYVQVFIQ